eukprot:2295081-Prorocentrum_lima.AAC.1
MVLLPQRLRKLQPQETRLTSLRLEYLLGQLTLCSWSRLGPQAADHWAGTNLTGVEREVSPPLSPSRP